VLVHTGQVIKLQLLATVVTFALWAYCLVGVISCPPNRVRNLPKLVWVLLVVLFPFVGSIAWLVAGRPTGERANRSAHERAQPAFPEYDRPGRAAAQDPQRDEEFLRRVRERAEEQRRRYEQSRRSELEQPAQAEQPVQPDPSAPEAQPDVPAQPEVTPQPDEPADPAGADAGEK
jgi:hypothetical protein